MVTRARYPPGAHRTHHCPKDLMPRHHHVAGSRAIVARVTALTLIAVGYVDLSRGGTVVAPLALAIGYLVVVPVALLTE